MTGCLYLLRVNTKYSYVCHYNVMVYMYYEIPSVYIMY